MGIKDSLKKIVPKSVMREYALFRERQIYKSEKTVDKLQDPQTRAMLFESREKKGLDKIPIFLVSYNRLSYLKSTIARLEEMGKTEIIIIDNASTYPPLLEYYKTVPYEIIYMDNNYGHMVFWEQPMFAKYREDFYILSDPDVIPAPHCPDDFVEKMFYILKKYPNIRKVGFSLKIDDFPPNGAFGPSVINWEKQFYKHKIKKDNVFLAMLDTTFALYVPDCLTGKNQSFYAAMRTGYPYEAQHLPWYRILGDITEEDEFYNKTTILSGWDVCNHRASQ